MEGLHSGLQVADQSLPHLKAAPERPAVCPTLVKTKGFEEGRSELQV